MTKHIKVLAVVCLLAFGIAPICAVADPARSEQVSIINLIATPEKYHGKKVELVGVARFEGGRGVACLSMEDAIHRLSLNCVSLAVQDGKQSYDELRTLDFKHVLVEGTFRTTRQEQWDGLPNSIVKIVVLRAIN